MRNLHRAKPGDRIYHGEGVTRRFNAEGRVVYTKRHSKPAAAAVRRLFGPPLPGPSGSDSNWVAGTAWQNTAPNPVQVFQTTWRVPNPPTNQSGQQIYLFSGMEPDQANPPILQPVLQWGVTPSGGGAGWSIATYYVVNSGPAVSTNAIPVNTGQQLQARIEWEGQDKLGYNYLAGFVGFPQTMLRASSVSQLAWCYLILESYGLLDNTGYPSDASTAITAIDLELSPTPAPAPSLPTIAWGAGNQSATTLQRAVPVSYSATNGEVDIYFR